MTIASRRRLAALEPWLKWLPAIPLAVYFVATQVVLNVEARVFADATRHVATVEHPVALPLKGDIFYVTADQKRRHDLAQDTAFGAMALMVVTMALGRWAQAALARTSPLMQS